MQQCGARCFHYSSSTHRVFLGHRKVIGTGRGLRFLFVVFSFVVFWFFLMYVWVCGFRFVLGMVFFGYFCFGLVLCLLFVFWHAFKCSSLTQEDKQQIPNPYHMQGIVLNTYLHSFIYQLYGIGITIPLHI